MQHKIIISGQAADTPERQREGKFAATNAGTTRLWHMKE